MEVKEESGENSQESLSQPQGLPIRQCKKNAKSGLDSVTR